MNAILSGIVKVSWAVSFECYERYHLEWYKRYHLSDTGGIIWVILSCNLKREAQGIKNVAQVAEWAPEYSPAIQSTIRFIGCNIIHEDLPKEKVHKILKVWGDALQTITNPKPSPPPTLKAWCLYKWKKFLKRTDKWGLFQWQLVIIGTMICVFFSSVHQKMTMDLDRTNRIFYKNVIMNEKRKKDYQELDSLIHSDSFFTTFRSLEHWNLTK